MGKFIITDAGKKLQAKVFAGTTKFIFTKIGVGDGFANSSADYAAKTDLVARKVDVKINKEEVKSSNICRVVGILENTGLTAALYVREVGLYATDPDDGEILFCAKYYDRPTIIDEESSGPYTKEFDFNIGIESADNVSITVDKAGIATQEDLSTSAKNTQAAAVTEMTGLYKSALIALLPAHYGRSKEWSGAKGTLTSPDYLTVNIGNSGFVLNGSLSINVNTAANWDNSTYATAANRKGKDFYIYACQPTSGTVPKIVLSANSTVPTGYTATNSRKIGGFHCECADVGTISGHTLSGYAAGDVLPASVWDLRHRPISSPEGMVFDGRRWIDIYIASWDGSKLVSKFNGVMADGESSPKFHGEKFEEEFAKVGKHLISRSDFMHCMKGIQEGVNIKGSADANTTGGHVNTNGVRIISNYGIEDCAGVIWQWGIDLFEGSSNGTVATDWYGVNGYSWDARSVYNADIDAAQMGSCLGWIRRVRLGAGWGVGADCGSRAANCNAFSAYRDGGSAGRGVSEPLAVSL